VPDANQKYYDAVAAEMEAKHFKPGLWARALAEAGEDDSRARALYIRMRVADLKESEVAAPDEPPPLPATTSTTTEEEKEETVAHRDKILAIRPLIVLRDVVGISVLVYLGRLAANTYIFTAESAQEARAWAGFVVVLLGFVISGCLAKDHRWKHLWLVAVGASGVALVFIEAEGMEIPYLFFGFIFGMAIVVFIAGTVSGLLRRLISADAQMPEQEAEPEGPQVRPWVRYFARMFDYMVFAFIMALIAAAFEYDPRSNNPILWGFADPLLWCFVEPLLLATFGTTPGKLLFNIRVRDVAGEKMGYLAGLRRAFLVWVRGMGCAIPIVTVFTLLISFRTLKADEITPWDAKLGVIVSHNGIGPVRVLIMAFLIVLFFALSAVAKSAGF
jgi:hypothetical protein